MAIAAFSLVALDCRDPLALAEFYQKIVGGEIESHTEDESWVRLKVDSASDMGFQLDAEHQPPSWPDGLPQQAHLDFDVVDLDEGEQQVLGIGARKADVQPQPEDWRVFLDPAGHPFCLCKA